RPAAAVQAPARAEESSWRSRLRPAPSSAPQSKASIERASSSHSSFKVHRPAALRRTASAPSPPETSDRCLYGAPPALIAVAVCQETTAKSAVGTTAAQTIQCGALDHLLRATAQAEAQHF